MARLQILELPEGASDDRPPFLLVIDQADTHIADDLRNTTMPTLASQIGARAVIAFGDTIDIPANQATVDDNSNLLPLRIRVEGDFDTFREQVQAEATAAASVLVRARDIQMRCDDRAQETFKKHLRDALGLDNDPSLSLVGAAHGIRLQRDQAQAAVAAVHAIHQPIQHRGTVICGHCSAWDGPDYDSTDNDPVAFPCSTVKALETKPATNGPETSDG